MIPLIRRMLNLDTVDAAVDVMCRQHALIEKWVQAYAHKEAEIQRLKVEYSRWGRDIIEQFLIALERSEDDDELRDRLMDALTDMNDEVARLEEFSR